MARNILFEPLAIQYYWKRTPRGVIDSEGGLYLCGEDLAKIGYLYLQDGMWKGKRIVSADWVRQSLTPLIDAEEGMKYGYKRWLYPRKDNGKLVWMCLGFGGQRLMVFQEEKLIVVFTGWQILSEDAPISAWVERVLPAVQSPACGASQS
jgi:CubicO group peptidase (beta-lactamase class C family)